jgi:hypothetical protein
MLSHDPDSVSAIQVVWCLSAATISCPGAIDWIKPIIERAASPAVSSGSRLPCRRPNEERCSEFHGDWVIHVAAERCLATPAPFPSSAGFRSRRLGQPLGRDTRRLTSIRWMAWATSALASMPQPRLRLPA